MSTAASVSRNGSASVDALDVIVPDFDVVPRQAGKNDTDGFVLAAQSGQSQGRHYARRQKRRC